MRSQVFDVIAIRDIHLNVTSRRAQLKIAHLLVMHSLKCYRRIVFLVTRRLPGNICAISMESDVCRYKKTFAPVHLHDDDFHLPSFNSTITSLSYSGGPSSCDDQLAGWLPGSLRHTASCRLPPPGRSRHPRPPSPAVTVARPGPGSVPLGLVTVGHAMMTSGALRYQGER